MDNRSTLLARFSRAANRRAHEMARLSQPQRDELARKIRAVREEHQEKLKLTRERHASQRADDMARARLEIMAQKWKLEFRPPHTPERSRIDRERVERLAACEVDAMNAHEIAQSNATMRQAVSGAYDTFLVAQPEFRGERESIDLLRVRWSEMRSATDYEGHSNSPGVERDAPDGGRDR